MTVASSRAERWHVVTIEVQYTSLREKAKGQRVASETPAPSGAVGTRGGGVDMGFPLDPYGSLSPDLLHNVGGASHDPSSSGQRFPFFKTLA